MRRAASRMVLAILAYPTQQVSNGLGKNIVGQRTYSHERHT